MEVRTGREAADCDAARREVLAGTRVQRLESSSAIQYTPGLHNSSNQQSSLGVFACNNPVADGVLGHRFIAREALPAPRTTPPPSGGEQQHPRVQTLPECAGARRCRHLVLTPSKSRSAPLHAPHRGGRGICIYARHAQSSRRLTRVHVAHVRSTRIAPHVTIRLASTFETIYATPYVPSARGINTRDGEQKEDLARRRGAWERDPSIRRRPSRSHVTARLTRTSEQIPRASGMCSEEKSS
ncbi:unnamed protein product [Diplocarpon coronariae]